MVRDMALLVLNPASACRQEVPLRHEAVSIGRDPSNRLVLPDVRVSRRHAVIEWRGGRYHLRDCGSLNGLTVNDDRVRESRLTDGDLVKVGATRLLFREGPATCDSPSPALPDPAAAWRECLTAQQASLVRAVALNRPNYLQWSYYRDPATGERVAHSLQEEEWSRVAARWAVEPVACIGAINRAIAGAGNPARLRRYLEAAVDLETLMDHATLRAPQGRVLAGIPHYIMDGYTDMGHNASTTVRRGREKIRVDKKHLKPWLVESRWRALAHEPPPEELLAGFYEAVQRSFSRDAARVRDLFCRWAETSINLSRFLDNGIGLCRHLSILYQLCLQEAAIPARVVKGSLRLFGTEGRHAWNLAWLGGRVALIDVTVPSRRGPLIVVGTSQEEVYRVANQDERRYVPTPDAQNHYKIGRPGD
jgi:hypothetical protein